MAEHAQEENRRVLSWTYSTTISASRSNIRSRIQSVYAFSTITIDVQQGHWTRKSIYSSFQADPFTAPGLLGRISNNNRLTLKMIPTSLAWSLSSLLFLVCKCMAMQFSRCLSSGSNQAHLGHDRASKNRIYVLGLKQRQRSTHSKLDFRKLGSWE